MGGCPIRPEIVLCKNKQALTNATNILITKDIYPKIAQRYDVSPATVEHDIRTIMRILWESNRDIIKPLFGYMPNKRPNNFQFLDALAFAYKTICTQEDFPNKELCPANQVIQADFE